MNAMDRPTIFISSTIYDFRDLRSAIKDHLETNGCRVLASEFNDFTKPLDKHSYQACLDTIAQADVFLLLVGSRVGGWYEETNRISITQQEYRTAYALAQEGRIRLLTFVRSDVWLHRQSTKELRKYLESLGELDNAIRKKIAAYPNSMAADSEFVVSFIDEISRNKETTAAAKGKGPVPIGNWIHPFTGFKDIRDAVDPLILKGLSVNKAAGRKALQNQLLTLLQQVVPIISGKPLIPDTSILKLSASLSISADKIGTNIRVSEAEWNRLAGIGVYAQKIVPDAMPFVAALGTDLLLDYDPANGTFKQTQAYDCLTELVDQIRQYEKIMSGYNQFELLKFAKNRNLDRSIDIPAHLVAAQLNMLFRWADMAGLAKVLAHYLDGKPLAPSVRMPVTPFLDQTKQLEAERVSLDQIREFVGIEVVATPVAETK
jgi:hypothetical protein